MLSKEDSWEICAILAEQVYDYEKNRKDVEDELMKHQLTLLDGLQIDSKRAMIACHEGDGELFVTYRGTVTSDEDDVSADKGILEVLGPGSSAAQVRGVVAGGKRPEGLNWMYDDAYNLAVRLIWSLDYYTKNVDTDKYSDQKITVVGHSLGGFIAGVVGMHKDTRVCAFNSAPGPKYALVDSDHAKRTSFIGKMNDNVIYHRTTLDPISGGLGAPSNEKNLPYGFMGYIDAWPTEEDEAHSMKNFTKDPKFFEAGPEAHGKAPTTDYYY